MKFNTSPLLVCTLGAAMFFAGCVYKIDVQQGNVVTAEQVAQLTPGMSKREVKHVLGTPLIDDPFHADRWDYYYSLKQGRSKEHSEQVVSVLFEQDTLTEIIGAADSATDHAGRIVVGKMDKSFSKRKIRKLRKERLKRAKKELKRQEKEEKKLKKQMEKQAKKTEKERLKAEKERLKAEKKAKKQNTSS